MRGRGVLLRVQAREQTARAVPDQIHSRRGKTGGTIGGDGGGDGFKQAHGIGREGLAGGLTIVEGSRSPTARTASSPRSLLRP